MFVFHFLGKWLRIILSFIVFVAFSTIVIFVCLLLLPFRELRIKLCNYYGIFMGKTVLFLLNASTSVQNVSRISENYPAIYIANHTSTLDIPIGISLCPVGGVGISKKEIAYIPFFGWIYLLSGHLLINRSNREAAIKSMNNVAKLVKKHNLSIWIWPEGTRSKDGRFQPLKKGFAHLAINTKLPIVPIVIHNAHKKWGKKTGLRITPGTIEVEILPKVDTSDWSVETLDDHISTVRQVFIEKLCDEQKPLIEV